MNEQTAYLVATITPFVMMMMIVLVSQIITGVLCKKLARRKGYKGYFFTGFFLGILGLIYVIGLPDHYAKQDMRLALKRLVNLHERVSALESAEDDEVEI